MDYIVEYDLKSRVYVTNTSSDFAIVASLNVLTSAIESLGAVDIRNIKIIPVSEAGNIDKLNLTASNDDALGDDVEDVLQNGKGDEFVA